jgi:hypothetical protein
MQALFEGKGPAGEHATLSHLLAQHESQHPVSKPRESSVSKPTGAEIKLISVMAAVTGEEVETRWGLHPRFRRDLTALEIQDLTRLMNRLTKIVGERYAAVAFSEQWASWHTAGNA